MVDPSTGRPVRPDDTISVGGARMRAGDYYRQLNDMEQWLNERGYSLRTDTALSYYSPLLESEITESEKRLKELEAQFPLSGEPATMGGGDFVPASCNSNARAFDTGWLGNSNFSMRLRGQGGYRYCVALPIAELSVGGEAVLEGRLSNNTAAIAEASAVGSIRTDDIRNAPVEYSYSAQVRVMGNPVWASSNQGVINTRYERSWDIPIAQLNWQSPIYDIGCLNVLGLALCVKGRLGISGNLRLAAGVDLSVPLQSVYAKPYGELDGYAEAWIGVDIGIAFGVAGVRGNVTFLRGGIRAEARGGIQAYGANPTCYDYGFGTYLIAQIDQALSGNLELFARGCIRFMRKWRCTENSWNLYSWNGFSWPDLEIGRWATGGISLGCL